jgi:hypothetical protein
MRDGSRGEYHPSPAIRAQHAPFFLLTVGRQSSFASEGQTELGGPRRRAPQQPNELNDQIREYDPSEHRYSPPSAVGVDEAGLGRKFTKKVGRGDSGGSAVIYKAVDLKNGSRPVAVKDPSARPPSNDTDLLQLRQIQAKRQAARSAKLEIYLELMPSAAQSVASRLEIEPRDALDYVFDDIADSPCLTTAVETEVDVQQVEDLDLWAISRVINDYVANARLGTVA